MKQWIILLLLLASIPTLPGCQQEAPELKDPVTFYYQRQNLTYNSSDGVIAGETRDADGHAHEPAYLLNVYLSGPLSPEFVSPFPSKVRLLALEIQETNAILTLNRRFSELTGLDLTIACACLTMTTISLTGVETVTIQADSAMLDSARQITMDTNCFLLLDGSTAAPMQED